MNRQSVLVLLLFIMVAGTLGYYFWPQPAPLTSAQLYDLAMNAPTIEEREKAVYQLAKHRDGKDYLRKLIQPSTRAGAREAAILALGDCRDFQSMPELVDLLDDPSEQVRGRAGMAVSLILGRNFPFDPSKPAEECADAVELIRRDYLAMKKSPPPMYRN